MTSIPQAPGQVTRVKPNSAALSTVKEVALPSLNTTPSFPLDQESQFVQRQSSHLGSEQDNSPESVPEAETLEVVNSNPLQPFVQELDQHSFLSVTPPPQPTTLPFRERYPAFLEPDFFEAFSNWSTF